jgi:hypothetical protein
MNPQNHSEGGDEGEEEEITGEEEIHEAEVVEIIELIKCHIFLTGIV